MLKWRFEGDEFAGGARGASGPTYISAGTLGSSFVFVTNGKNPFSIQRVPAGVRDPLANDLGPLAASLEGSGAVCANLAHEQHEEWSFVMEAQRWQGLSRL